MRLRTLIVKACISYTDPIANSAIDNDHDHVLVFSGCIPAHQLSNSEVEMGFSEIYQNLDASPDINHTNYPLKNIENWVLFIYHKIRNIITLFYKDL